MTGTVRYPLSRGRELLVSQEDAHLLERHRWHVRGDGYVARNPARSGGHRRGAKVLLHVEIVRPPAGLLVDHVSGDRLDCRRENLRLATTLENGRNRRAHGGTSRFKGVCWNKASEKWQADIRVSGRKIYLGLHENEEDAARAYDAAARQHFGEFARPNFGEVEL